MTISRAHFKYLEERVQRIVRNKQSAINTNFRDSTEEAQYAEIKEGRAKLRPQEYIKKCYSVYTAFEYSNEFNKVQKKAEEHRDKLLDDLIKQRENILDTVYLGDSDKVLTLVRKLEAMLTI